MISVLSGPGYVIKYASLIIKFGITYFAALLPIIIYFYLRRNPMTIHCSGCMEDGATYKCKKGTGKHSAACRTYQTTMKGIIGTFNVIKGMIGVIILEIIGSLLMIVYFINNKLVNKHIIQLVNLVFLAFLIVVTLLYHPPTDKLIPFSNA